MSPIQLPVSVDPAGHSRRVPENEWMHVNVAKRRLFAAAHLGLTAQLKPQSQLIHRWFVPGRLEFLGKHTDYCLGRSILGAIDRGICFCVSARSDTRLRMLDAQNGSITELDVSTSAGTKPHGWSVYPATVARRLAGMVSAPMRGADVAFISDLPAAAGLSSSSCLIVGFYLALAQSNAELFASEHIGLPQDPVALGDFLGCIESGRAWRDHGADTGVGTRGGSQDHTAILCSTPGKLTAFDFYDSRTIGSVALPDDLTFAIAVSGVSAHKTGSAGAAYNRVSKRAATCVQLWQDFTHRPGECMEAIFRSGPESIQAARQALRQSKSKEFSAQSLLSRLEQYDRESHQLIPAAMAAMQCGNWMELGNIVDESQRLAETCLHNQVPQTQRLAATARGLDAVAASAFGAGFGGAVWALVEKARVGTFLRQWREAYLSEFPSLLGNASFFQTILGLPATELPIIQPSAT